MAKIEVKSAELLQGLSAVLPHAAPDAECPALEGVRFASREDGGGLDLAATQRYTLGVWHLQSAQTSEPVAFTLRLSAAKDWVRALKTPAKYDWPVVVETEGDQVTLRAGETTISAVLSAGEYPKLAPVLVQAGKRRDDAAPVNVIAFNPRLLGLFQAAAGKCGMIKLEMGNRATDPVGVTVTNETAFEGVIMPYRLPS